ncbi:MAG: hypothetical protein SFT92_10050 [Rickettsiales bacterium]|nr:hypothetical protein [Rickettsiales bacterium]
MKKTWLLIACFSSISACAPQSLPPEVYGSRSDPETLLDTSSEVVTMDLRSRNSLSKLASIVRSDQPNRAELHCKTSDILCAQAKEILTNQNVPIRTVGNDNSVTLVYERVVARDCDSRYIDARSNQHNVNQPSFGCSMRANTVQMVSNRRVFTDPALTDLQDAEKGRQNYQQYLLPTPPENDKSALESILGTVSSSSGSSR